MGFPAFELMDSGSTPTNITTVSLGSDDLSEELRRSRGGVAHERYGTVVASRTWKNSKVWTLNLNGVTQSYLESLRPFFEAGAFYFYPDVDITATKYTVFWTSNEFNPQYLAPDLYSLRATIKESTIGAGTPVYVGGGSGDQSIGGNLIVTGDLTVGGTLDVGAITGPIAAEYVTEGVFGDGASNYGFDLGQNGYLDIEAGQIRMNAMDYAGGWARGTLWFDSGATAIGGLGVLGTTGGDADGVTYMYAGYGSSPWSTTFLRMYTVGAEQGNVSVTNDLAVGGNIEATSWIGSQGSLLGANIFANRGATSTGTIQFSGGGYNTSLPQMQWTLTGDKFNLNRDLDVTGQILSGGTDIGSILGGGGGLTADQVEDQITGQTHNVFETTGALTVGTNAIIDASLICDGKMFGSEQGLKLDYMGVGGSTPIEWKLGSGVADLAFDTTTSAFTISHTLEAADDVLVAGSITGASGSFGSCSSPSFSNIGGIFRNYGQFDFYGSTLGSYSGLVHTKSMTIVEPQAGDEATMFKCTRDILITEIVIVGRGTSANATWALRYNSDRNGTPSTIKNGVTDSFSTTVGDTYTSFTNDDPADGDWLWFEVSATGGTSVDELHIDVTYRDL